VVLSLSGHTEPTGLYGCSLGQSGHLSGSHAIITQIFENYQKSVLCRTLVVNMSMKYWFARVETVRDLLSDLSALENRRHFESNSSTDKRDKTPFFAN
jgi:hypothetical protein